MARKASSQPTDVELEILRVLWQGGPSSVRDVHIAMQAGRGTGYSTTLKMMQIMHEKGLLRRDESRRPQLYRPSVPEDQTQARIVDHVIQRVFGGSARKLVLRAIQSESVTPQELAEIRKLLRQTEGGKP